MTVGSHQPPAPHSVALAHPPSPTRSPLLTWRDMQHLVVRASRPAQLQAEDWRTNGAGRRGAAGPGGGRGRRKHRAVTAGPSPCSEPPLWLRAAGRCAAGGPGSLLAAHAAPEEMCHSYRAHPHVSAPLCPQDACIQLSPYAHLPTALLPPAILPIPPSPYLPPPPALLHLLLYLPSPSTSHCYLGSGHREACPEVSVYPSEQGKGRLQDLSPNSAWPPTSRPAGEALAPIPILPVMHVRKNVSACAGHANSIRSLEHVQVQLSLSYSRRGDLEISLTSPMGTRSTLVAIRCRGRGQP